jgi:hypothetical protein
MNGAANDESVVLVSGITTFLSVMPGLVPGIHVFLDAKTWMAGTSPAMTRECSRCFGYQADIG